MLKKFPSGKISGRKKAVPSFYFCELQLITDLLLTCDSYMSSSTSLLSLKLCVGFSSLDTVLFY